MSFLQRLTPLLVKQHSKIFSDNIDSRMKKLNFNKKFLIAFSLKYLDKRIIILIFVLTESATLPVRSANQGGSFAFMSINRLYTKQPLSIADQIKLLKNRGLQFNNETYAAKFLSEVSYFRFIQYLRPMEADKASHIFKTDSKFEDALTLYNFDTQLRILMFEAIQAIEIALRTKINHEFSVQHGAFWFYDTRLADDEHKYIENLNAVDRELQRSKEEFIKEHRQKYDKPVFPPSWKTLELASFGTLSKLYYNCNDTKTKKRIARQFNLPQHEVLESWMRSLTVIRNCCAHHSRIWNRRLTNAPQMSVPLRGSWIDTNGIDGNKLYAIICCITYWLDSIERSDTFKAKLKSLITAHPSVDVTAMGFPTDWKDQPLWA